MTLWLIYDPESGEIWIRLAKSSLSAKQSTQKGGHPLTSHLIAVDLEELKHGWKLSEQRERFTVKVSEFSKRCSFCGTALKKSPKYRGKK